MSINAPPPARSTSPIRDDLYETKAKAVLEAYWTPPTATELPTPTKPSGDAFMGAYNAIYSICTVNNHDESGRRVMPPLETFVQAWVAGAKLYIENGDDSQTLERYLAAWEVLKTAKGLASRIYAYPDRHLFPQWDDGNTRTPSDYARQPYERFIPSGATALRRWRTDIYEKILNNDKGVEIIKAAIPEDKDRRKELRETLMECGAQYGEGPIDALK